MSNARNAARTQRNAAAATAAAASANVGTQLASVDAAQQLDAAPTQQLDAAPTLPSAAVVAVPNVPQFDSVPNVFGTAYAHNAMGTLHGDECCLCGKRTAGGRGVQYIGYALDTRNVLNAGDVQRYNAAGGNATLVLIGEACYYAARATLKQHVVTVRSKAGEALRATLDSAKLLEALALNTHAGKR